MGFVWGQKIRFLLHEGDIHPSKPKSLFVPLISDLIWNPEATTNSWYGWWKKSCTTWIVKNHVNNGISYLSTGAGFLPSTVLLNSSKYLVHLLRRKAFGGVSWQVMTGRFWKTRDSKKIPVFFEEIFLIHARWWSISGLRKHQQQYVGLTEEWYFTHLQTSRKKNLFGYMDSCHDHWEDGILLLRSLDPWDWYIYGHVPWNQPNLGK